MEIIKQKTHYAKWEDNTTSCGLTSDDLMSKRKNNIFEYVTNSIALVDCDKCIEILESKIDVT